MLDRIIHSSRVITMDPDRPIASSIGVLNGQIVGVDEQITSVSAKTIVDYGEATIVPGFRDCHNHLVQYGLSFSELDLSSLNSLDELYSEVQKSAARKATDEWIVGFGYDDYKLGGHPNKDVLDRVSGGSPVWLKHRSVHLSAVNSAVLTRLGTVLDAYANEEVPRYSNGTPTGLLKERAQGEVKKLRYPYSLSEIRTAILIASEKYASEGITQVAEAGIGAGWISHSGVELSAYQQLLSADQLSIRVEVMPEIGALHEVVSHLSDDMPIGLDLGVQTGFGNDHLWIGPAKLFLDGGFSSRTGAMTEPYSDTGGKGMLSEDRDLLLNRIIDAHRSGWSVAAHAIGDGALDLAIEAFEMAKSDHPVEHWNHRVEHGAMIRDDQLARLANLNIAVVPQARFIYEIGDSLMAGVGKERYNQVYRHRSLLQAGIRVGGSSDRPCVTDGSPLSGMRSMIERRTRAGSVLGEQERVDRLDALRAYTSDAALIANRGSRMDGTIQRGRYADLVVLDKDPLETSSREYDGINVIATYLNGGLVFEN